MGCERGKVVGGNFFGQRDEPYIVPIQNRGSPTPSSTSI